MTNRRGLAIGMAGLLVLGIGAAAARAGRYEAFTKKAAEGAKMKLLAATFFGGPGNEEFVDVGCLPDGTIVAFGNAWGPARPHPAAVVLGKGAHRGLACVTTDKRGNKAPRTDDPDMAGMIVFFDGKLRSVVKCVLFDWGVASISAGAVSADGKAVILAGRATEAFAALAKTSPVSNSFAQPAAPAGGRSRRKPDVGPYVYEGVQCVGDAYVLRMALKDHRIEWVWTLKGFQAGPGRCFQDSAGSVYFQRHGLHRIAADGKAAAKLRDGGSYGDQVCVRNVDADGSGFYLAGDRNTSTGREPYRNPVFQRCDQAGQKVYALWEWSSRLIGTDKYRLVSDSSPRHVAFYPNGDPLVAGWSDGGNTVFTRQAKDLDKPVPPMGFGMTAWGMKSANSLAHFMRVDPKTFETKGYAVWVAYVPDDFADKKYRGAPNAASVDRLLVLPSGPVAFTGRAATGLIQTPNSFYKYAHDGQKHGGATFTVFSGDFAKLLFSSYVPGCTGLAAAATPGGVVVVGCSGADGGHMGGPPVLNAIQAKPAGDLDGHIFLMALP